MSTTVDDPRPVFSTGSRVRVIQAILARAMLVPLFVQSAIAADAPAVELYRLKMPDGKGNINQASDLCIGRVGRYDGLWIAPDRNAGESGNQIFLIDRARLAQLEPGGDAVATQGFRTVGPVEGWDRFIAAHSRIDRAAMTELRRQFENSALGQAPILDFEGITIAPCSNRARSASEGTGPHTRAASGPAAPTTESLTLFVVTEQPNSIVLEFTLVDDDHPRLVLIDCFFYPEKPEDRGGDANDGIEGIAWTGKPGQFFICEEGTRPYLPGNTLHFFDQPRLMRCTLNNAWCNIEEPWSTRATESVRSQRDKPSQTLNGLMRLDDRTLLAVDRNGGWILAVDIPTGRARRWLSLYDPKGLNLRERLANFPAPRHMPYVSIEGIALDDRGDLWLCDDPAMPEGFRESCLIRLRHPPPLPKE